MGIFSKRKDRIPVPDHKPRDMTVDQFWLACEKGDESKMKEWFKVHRSGKAVVDFEGHDERTRKLLELITRQSRGNLWTGALLATIWPERKEALKLLLKQHDARRCLAANKGRLIAEATVAKDPAILKLIKGTLASFKGGSEAGENPQDGFEVKGGPEGLARDCTPPINNAASSVFDRSDLIPSTYDSVLAPPINTDCNLPCSSVEKPSLVKKGTRSRFATRLPRTPEEDCPDRDRKPTMADRDQGPMIFEFQSKVSGIATDSPVPLPLQRSGSNSNRVLVSRGSIFTFS